MATDSHSTTFTFPQARGKLISTLMKQGLSRSQASQRAYQLLPVAHAAPSPELGTLLELVKRADEEARSETRVLAVIDLLDSCMRQQHISYQRLETQYREDGDSLAALVAHSTLQGLETALNYLSLVRADVTGGLL